MANIDKVVSEINNPVLKMSNRLIEGRYNLTVAEQKILIAMSAVIAKSGDRFEVIQIPVKELIKFCGFEEKKGYNIVKTTTKQLLRRSLEIQYENGDWFGTHWLQSALYKSNEAIIIYEIDKHLKDDFLNLYKAYLSSPANLLVQFNSKYTPRLYNLLKKMIKKSEFDYNISFFFDRFLLPDSYKIHTHFEKKFLKICVDEINEKSDIQVKYYYIKEGRSYKKIHFIVLPKKKEKPLISESPTKRVKLTDEEQAIYDRLTNDTWQITDDVARKMIKKYKLKRIENAFKYAKANKQGKYTMSGWLIDCIEKDYAGNKAKTDKEKRVREQAREADRKQADKLFHGENNIEGDYSAPVIIKDGKIVSK